MANGLVRELREVEPRGGSTELPPRDARAARPLPLRGILRFELLRRAARVAMLASLDVGGLYLAIWTALAIKALVRHPSQFGDTFKGAADVLPLAALVTLLLFANSGLYRDRPLRPGFSKVIASLFQVTVVILIYAKIQGQHFESYYIFYGSLFFALLYVSGFRWVSSWLLRAAGYRRRAALVGSGSNIDAVAHALKDSSEIEPYAYVSLTPHGGDGLRDFRSLEQLERHLDVVEEVLIADPEFPQDRAVELVDTCHRHGVRVRVAPSTMEILMDRVEFVPGQAVPLFELKPPVFEGVDFAVKRVFDLVVSALLLVVLGPLMAVIALAIKLTSRGPVLYRSMRAGIGG